MSAPSLHHLLGLSVLFAILCVHLCDSHSDNALLLLVSFDGFRWDYIEKAKTAGQETHNFDFLMSSGVTIKPPGGVKNAFATFTFPNHYSIATGLYEENHGVVHNEMFDPETNETFHNSAYQNENPKWWNNGTDGGGPEPIWITNQRDSRPGALFPKRSGVYFWPGSVAPNHGTRPFHYLTYDETVDYRKRIDSVLDWFSTEEDPINFGMLYFDEPDNLGHDVGPDDPALMKKIAGLDNLVGYLLDGMDNRSLRKKLNLIITSDHGMTNIYHYISLDEFVNPDLYSHFGESPVWHIVPEPGKEQEVYEGFSKIANTTLYKKEEIPDHFRYKHNKRIMPLVLVADKGYELCHNSTSCHRYNGDHGYSNDDPEMQPIFLANGPSFHKGLQMEQFEIVDIYPLICHLLDIEPAPNDGDLTRVEGMIFHQDNSFQTITTFCIVTAFAATISSIFILIICKMRRNRRIQYKKTTVALEQVNHTLSESHTHLLSSDEEEIP